MHELEANYARLALKYRWLAIVASLALVLAAASGVRLLEFQPDYRVFFDPRNPELVAFEEMENTYTRSDNIMFVVAPRDENIFTRDNLAALKDLTDRSWQIKYSTRVDSITNYQHTAAEGDDLAVGDLVANPGALTDAELAHIQEIALNEPLLVRRMIAADGRVAGINVRTLIPRVDQITEVPQLMASAREAAAEFRARYPDIELYLAGQMTMDASFPEAGQKDMQGLVPVSFLAMAALLLVLTRSLTGTLVTLLVVALSILGAMGLRGYTGLPLTVFSGNTPIIILTMAIANCVHILTNFRQCLQRGEEKRPALEESLRINLQPVTLASITTAIGFTTLNSVAMPPVGWMGNTAAVGVLISLLLSITLLPALLSLLPVRVNLKAETEVSSMNQLGRFVVAKRRLLLPAMGLVIFVLLALIPNNELNESIIDNNFDQTFEIRRSSDFIVENLTGIFTVDYNLSAKEPGGVSKPEFLIEVEKLTTWLRPQEEVIHVNSITDTMKRLNQNLHMDDPSWYRIPQDRDLSAQYLLLYEMSLPYGLDLNDQLNVDKSATRISVTTRTLATRELVAFEASVQEWLRENTQHIEFGVGVGVSFMFSSIVERSTPGILTSTIVALVAISMLLAVVFRSVRFGMVSLIPNLFPAAMGFGIWSLIHGEVGMGLSIVMGLTLGIVIDDTVHFMSKYLRARRELDLDPQAAVVYAFSTVGQALLVTSVILTVGFLILSTSHFGANADMARLTAIVVGLALVVDFLFLPPLLLKLEQEGDTPVNATAGAQSRIPN